MCVEGSLEVRPHRMVKLIYVCNLEISRNTDCTRAKLIVLSPVSSSSSFTSMAIKYGSIRVYARVRHG